MVLPENLRKTTHAYKKSHTGLKVPLPKSVKCIVLSVYSIESVAVGRNIKHALCA